jgi:uncharacterized protein
VPRTPARSPARPDPAALPDPLHLPWRPPRPPAPRPGVAGTAPGAADPRTGAAGPAPGLDPRTLADGPAQGPDPRADAGWAAGLPEAGAADRRLIEAQIGREVRGSVAVATRCRYGLPAVVRTAPLLPDGTPFPTLYWLACPAARVAVGRLEAAGWNALLSERVAADPELAAAHAAAHERYLAQRDAMAPLPGDPGVGGLPGRVKCLHALYAHQAATGANPIGRIVSQAVDPIDCPGPCVDPAPTSTPRPPTPGPSAPEPPASGPPAPGSPASFRPRPEPHRPVSGPSVGEATRTGNGGDPVVHSPGNQPREPAPGNQPPGTTHGG